MPSTPRFAIRILALASLCLTLFAPAPARADLIDTVLGIVAPEYAEAKSVVQCIVNKGSFNESIAKTCIEQQAKAAAQSLVPNDPKLKSIIDTVLAAKAGDWVRVLEIIGTDGLQTVACSIVGPGPVNTLLCGPLFAAAKPVMKPALQAVLKGDWWGLVTLLGPDVACKVIPGGDIKNAICGPLADTIKFAVDTAKEAAKYGKEAGEFLLNTGEDILKGGAAALNEVCKFATLCSDDDGKQYLSADGYYKYILFPRIHDRVRGELVPYASWGAGFDPVRKTECLVYYDYYTFNKSTNATIKSLAQQLLGRCENLVARLRHESDAVVAAMKAAPSAYVEAKIRPHIAYAVVENYDYGTGKIAEFVKFFSAPCVPHMQGLFPIPKPTKTTETAWQHVCGEVAKIAESAYKQEQGKLGWTLASLKKAGCTTAPKLKQPGAATPGIKLACDSYAGYQQCLTALSAGIENKHCSLNQNQADAQLAKQIVQLLASKRCTAAGNQVICTRPWKIDACKTVLAAQPTAGLKPGVTCSPPPTAAQIAFAALVSHTQDIVYTLNGGVKKSAGTKTGKGEAFVQVLPLSDNCKTMWDPLAITCKNPGALATLQGVTLGQCPADPNKDGADKPCYGGPLSKATADKATAKAGVASADIGGAVPKAERAKRPGGGFKSGNSAAPDKPVSPLIPGADNNDSRTVALAPQHAALPAASRPRLTIGNVQVKIEPNCQSPQPALTAAITINNTGGPLPAGKGTVYLKETGGANLSSAGIHLPAFGAGQTQVVQVAAMTLNPYPALAGSHQLRVYLNPLVETGGASFDAATPYPFSVNFPVGHCDSRTTQPAPMRSAPEPARPTTRR